MAAAAEQDRENEIGDIRNVCGYVCWPHAVNQKGNPRLNLREKKDVNMSRLKWVLFSTLIVPIAANCQTVETVIYNFTGTNGDGVEPLGPPVAGTPDLTGRVNAIYGVTSAGGSTTGVCAQVGGCGTVYQLSRPGPGQTAWAETLPFANFLQSNGTSPAGGLFLQQSPASPGPTFFGTTLYGGSNGTTTSANSGYGTVFSLVGNQLTTLWDFSAGVDERNPSGALIADNAAGIPGVMYGTTRGFHNPSYGTVFSIENGVGSLSTIWTFSGSDGKRPLGALLADKTGALYGLTFEGGANGSGAVFKLTPPGSGLTAWTYQTLWSFTGGSDGGNPEQPDPLIMDQSGALYGTTYTGGNPAFCADDGGCGVVFKLIPPTGGQAAWTEQTLWSFTGGADGGYPINGVIMDKTGALYGMTNGGGNPGCVPFQAFDSGCGVVFKLTPPCEGPSPWALTTLWAFGGPPSDGANPWGGLIADGTGTLYGTTAAGGSASCGGGGCGAVFQLTGTGFLPLSTLLGGSQIAVTSSGLAYSRVSQTFNGTVTITNISNSTIVGPFQIVLYSLTAGATLMNATGAFGEWSYVTVPAAGSLAPGQSASVTVEFKNPSNATINFTPVTYSGSFN